MVKPFALSMPMVIAANISDEALKGITNLIVIGNKELRKSVHHFIKRVEDPANEHIPVEEFQSTFSNLKLRFNALLDELDIFADVTAQRSEHETGVWVAGLDALAEDALQLKGNYYIPPPVMCYLERGHGAAIRRARTRLPGGKLSPVAVIQVPRERMIGSGIAASLVHEVGHQGAALLGLMNSIRQEIRKAAEKSNDRKTWDLYYRWLSEIIADFWALGHLGIGATLGLMSVVSLPRYFMFRMKLDDPHPFPWIRVKLSLEFGKVLYPHPQWQRFEKLWHSLYPVDKLEKENLQVIKNLNQVMPQFIKLVINHSPTVLKGSRLMHIFPFNSRQPIELQRLFNLWHIRPEAIGAAPPSLVFAVIGQAHADATLSAAKESKILSEWLTRSAFLRSEKRTTNESRRIMHEIKNLITD